MDAATEQLYAALLNLREHPGWHHIVRKVTDDADRAMEEFLTVDARDGAKVALVQEKILRLHKIVSLVDDAIEDIRRAIEEDARPGYED